VNKVRIEKNSDGTYNVDLPNGGQGHALSPQQVVKRLNHAEQEFQTALDDIKARRQEFERMASD
jgi:hypothetical protein